MAAKSAAGILQKTGVFHGGGADDDVVHAQIDVALNRVQIANAAAQLHRNFAIHLFQDGLDGRQILGLAGKGTIQIDQMQAPCPGIEPAAGHFGRVTKNGGLVHIALFQAYTLAVFQVDGRNEQHGCLKCKKWRKSARLRKGMRACA